LLLLNGYAKYCWSINQSINKIVIKWQTDADKCTSKKKQINAVNHMSLYSILRIKFLSFTAVVRPGRGVRLNELIKV